MACLCLTELLFKIAYVVVVIGYPASLALKSIKDNQPSRLYISYFLTFGLLIILENTLLCPVKMIIDLVSTCLYPTIKLLVCLWLIHPNYRGALFVDQKLTPIVSKYFSLVNEKAGKVLSIVGIPARV